MENKYLQIGISALIGLLVGKFALQSKPQIVEKIKTVEVEKIVKVEDKKKREQRKEVTRPDGTKEVTVIIDEESKTKETKDKELVATSEKSSKFSGVTLGLLAIKDSQDFAKQATYGIHVSAPIYGSVKLQALGTSDKKVGLGLGLEF